MKADSPPSSSLTSGILWIASYPKSGNTWVRAFLNNMMKIIDGDNDGGAQDINRINEYTLWDLSASRYERHLGLLPEDVSRSEIARVRPLVQAEMAARADGLAMVKTHHALVEDRGHPSINFSVTAGAVYIVRNPLDIAVSFAAHMGAPIDHAVERMAIEDLETAVTSRNVYEIYGSWSQHVESWTRAPHRAIHVMRYEDMLANPAAAFGALARHLLLSPTAEQLAIAIERSSFATLKKQEEEAGFSEKPDSAQRFFREGKANQWREALTPCQVRAIAATHHQQMRRFGYLIDELLPLIG